MQSIALVTQSERSGQDDINILKQTEESYPFCCCVFASLSAYSLSVTAVAAALSPVCCVVEGMITMCHANYAKRISGTDKPCGYQIADNQAEHMQCCRSLCCPTHCLCYKECCGITQNSTCPSSWIDCDCLFNDGKPCGRNSACCGGDEPQATATSKQRPFYVNSMQADTPMVLMPIMLKS